MLSKPASEQCKFYLLWISCNLINPTCFFFARIVYCDETDEENSNVNVHQPTTFAHKNLKIEGITVFWVEFSDASHGACKSSPPPTVGVVSLLILTVTELCTRST